MPGRSVPVEELTSPTAAVFANPDGTRTALVTAGPARFRAGDGTWVDYDLDLVARGDGTLGPAAHPAPAAIDPATATVGLPTPAGTVTMTHPGARPAGVSLAGPAVRFPDALGPGADLVQEALVRGVKESYVLAAPERSSAAWTLELGLPPGVTARATAGAVELVAGSGAVLAALAGGVASDAAGAETPVSMRLAGQDPGRAVVSAEVDPVWLADPARAAPVTVDPTLVTTDAPWGGFDTYVNSDACSPSAPGYWAQAELRVGSDNVLRECGGNLLWRRARAFLRFPVQDVAGPGTTVTSAVMRLYVFDASRDPVNAKTFAAWGLAGFPTRDTNWSNQPLTTAPVSTAAIAGPGWYAFDVTALANDWVQDPSGGSNTGVAVLAAGEGTDPFSLKRIRSAEAGASQPVLVMTFEEDTALDASAAEEDLEQVADFGLPRADDTAPTADSVSPGGHVVPAGGRGCPQIRGAPYPPDPTYVVETFVDIMGCPVPLRYGKAHCPHRAGDFGLRHIENKRDCEGQINHETTPAAKQLWQRALVFARVPKGNAFMCYFYHYQTPSGRKRTMRVYVDYKDYLEQGHVADQKTVYPVKGITSAFWIRGHEAC